MLADQLIRNFTCEEKLAIFTSDTSDTSKVAYMPLVYRRVFFSPEKKTTIDIYKTKQLIKLLESYSRKTI